MSEKAERLGLLNRVRNKNKSTIMLKRIEELIQKESEK